MESLVMLLGLVLSACGHALLHDWRGAVAVYEGLDERFPPAIRTPAEVAGPLLLVVGAVCVVMPMLGSA